MSPICLIGLSEHSFEVFRLSRDRTSQKRKEVPCVLRWLLNAGFDRRVLEQQEAEEREREERRERKRAKKVSHSSSWEGVTLF